MFRATQSITMTSIDNSHAAFSTKVFIDTNVVLECLGLDQLPWNEIDRVGPILVLVTPTVLKEVDSKKHHSRLADHARRFNRLIGQSVITGKNVVLRAESPSVELAVATCGRPDWSQLTDLDPHDPDSKVIAEVLSAQSSAGQGITFISHDIRPLAMARAHGIKVHHIGDNWLRPREQSEAEKKAARLLQRVVELEDKQPQFEISLEYATTEPIDIVRVRELTAQEKLDLIHRILDANPEPSQSDNGLSSLSGFGGWPSTRDHSLSSRYDKYQNKAVPEFVNEYHRKLELMLDQVALTVKVANIGRVPAEAIIIDIRACGGWLNKKYIVGSPMGPRVPKPKIEPFPYIPPIYRIEPPSIVGRHEIEIAEAPKRSRHAAMHCEDFRHGTEFAYSMVAWLDPRDGDNFELTVTVTAANMPGETVRTFNIPKRIRDVEAADLVDYETFKLRTRAAFADVLKSAAETSKFDLIEWDDKVIE
jgi:hypothetical protein